MAIMAGALHVDMLMPSQEKVDLAMLSLSELSLSGVQHSQNYIC